MTVHFKLKHKFFLIILSANLLLCLVIIGISWRDFENEFTDYRARIDFNEAIPLEQLIIEQYQKSGELKINKRFWKKLEALYRVDIGFADEPSLNQDLPSQVTPEDAPRPFKQQGGRPRPPVDQFLKRIVINVDNTIYSPLVEFEKNKERVTRLKKEMLKINMIKDVKWRRVKVGDKVVAKIGVVSQRNLMAQVDQNFANDQKQNFLISLIAAFCISIVIGLFGARLFSKPIDKISKATKTLAQGDYNIELPVKGNDEIAQLARDLHILSQTLSSNLNAKNQWIADISHELRTPVAVTKAQIEAMLDGIRKPNDENLTVLGKQIEDLSKLINDLHELSLSDLGAMNYQFDEMNLSESLNMVVNEQAQTDFAIETNIDESLNVFADRGRLDQLFRNLMQNTIKYTDAPGKILIEAKIEDQTVMINWHDSGPGVSDEQLSKMFERLYRAENSRNRSTGGSGLGLSICQNIVSAHQGKIYAQHSHLGGINITIELKKEIKNVG